jgi:hypothetical protein
MCTERIGEADGGVLEDEEVIRNTTGSSLLYASQLKLIWRALNRVNRVRMVFTIERRSREYDPFLYAGA